MLMTGALSLQAAQEKVLAECRSLPSREAVDLNDAWDHVLSEPVVAPRDLPQAPTSIVDGFAICTADLDANAAATTFLVKRQRVDGAAGAIAMQEDLRPLEAAYVTTGALLPPRANAVRPTEESELAPQESVRLTSCEAGKWVRWPGSDMKSGSSILPAGHCLTAWDLSALAAAGVVRPRVVRKPVVAVLSTGRELLDPHAPAEELSKDRIFDANRYMLMRMAKDEGVEALDMGIATDDRESIRKSLLDASTKADVVVCTGGVSEGDFDFVRPVLREMAELLFDKVIVKPGKPATCAVRRASTEDGQPAQQQVTFFGLPGNPASAAVTFQLLVVPVLQRLAGKPSHGKPLLPVKVEERVVADPQRPEYIRASVKWHGEELIAMHTGLQRSSRAASLAGAQALLHLGAGQDVEAGSVVQATMVSPMPGNSFMVQAGTQKLETEAATFRRVVRHFQEHVEVQNIDVMNLAGFCRNCLSKWYMKAAGDSGCSMDLEAARLIVYGMPYDVWKAKQQQPASAEQKAAFDAKHSSTDSSGCCKPKDAGAAVAAASDAALGGAVSTSAESQAWEGAAFRKLVGHLQDNAQVPDNDLMQVAGFGRASLVQWYQEASVQLGCSVDHCYAYKQVHGEATSVAVAEKPRAPTAGPPVGGLLTSAAPKHSDVCTGGSAQGGMDQATSVAAARLRVGVVTVSDRASAGVYEDLSGPAVSDTLKAGLQAIGEAKPERIRSIVVPDDRAELERVFLELCDGEDRMNLVLTTGGTGFGLRDITPEVTKSILDKEALGLALAALQAGAAKHPMALASRLVAGVRKQTVILNLPGSPNGAADCLLPLVPLLVHAVALCDNLRSL